MEEVQKNEPGRQPEKEKKPKRELSPKEVQRRRKMIVFPLMFLAFAGCMYLIFAPSGKEKTETESVGGFNADIPLPAEDGIIADKQTAYEQAMMSRKRQDRIQSLQDFGFIGDDETEEPQAEAGLMPEEDPKPVRGGGTSSSATAYRDINRQLSTFYETPPEDREKEDLKRQVAELTEKLERPPLTNKWLSWKSHTSLPPNMQAATGRRYKCQLWATSKRSRKRCPCRQYGTTPFQGCNSP